MATCFERTFVDLSTGVLVGQFRHKEATVTAALIPHPYRMLRDKAYVTIDKLMAHVDDDRFEQMEKLLVNDTMLVLQEGCEIDVDNDRLDQALEDIEECGVDWEDAQERRPDLFTRNLAQPPSLLVPFIINDGVWPTNFKILVRFESLKLKANRLSGVGTGPHVGETYTCAHTVMTADCLACIRRAWEGE